MLFPGIELSLEALEAIGMQMENLKSQGTRLDYDRVLVLGIPTVSDKDGLGISWVEIPPKHWTEVNVKSVAVH